jgi:lysophospholipase L1-like esterase
MRPRLPRRGLWLWLLLVGLLATACGGSGSSSAAPPRPTATPTEARPAALSTVPPSPNPSPSPLASPSALAKPLVYVAIGASETVGVGADDPATEGWVPRLAQRLGAQTRLRNLGVSGTLLSTALRDQLPQAIQAQPDLVTVWLAVNDLNAQVPLASYRADLDALLARLAGQTHARVVVGNVPDLSLVPVYQGQDRAALRAEVGQWNTAIDQVAASHGAKVVDLHTGYAELALHPEYISADGFHPSAAGYVRVAELFYAVAAPLLAV